jgi:hypothetical protein
MMESLLHRIVNALAGEETGSNLLWEGAVAADASAML